MKQNMKYGNLERKSTWKLLDIMYGILLFLETHLQMNQEGTIQKQWMLFKCFEIFVKTKVDQFSSAKKL